MLKNLLYTLSLIFTVISSYLIYLWYICEPTNKEPLPAFLSSLVTIVTLIITWRFEYKPNNEGISVNKINHNSIVDIDEKKKNITISKVNKKSKVFINKGKNSLEQNNLPQ